MKKMKLTERQKNIILMLLEDTSQAITTSKIADRLNLSSRTVKRDITMVEKWFSINDFKLIKKPGVGLIVDEDDNMRNLISDLLKMENIEKSYHKNDRIKFILSRLLMADQPIKYYVFTNYLKISDKTLTQDLGDVEKWLADLNIKIVKKPGEGVYILGNKNSLRKAQINLIHEYLDDTKRLDLIRDLSLESSVELIEENDVYSMINRKTLDKVKRVLSGVFKSLNLKISDNSYIGLLVHISLTIERLLLEENIEVKKEYINNMSNSKEYMFSRIIVDDLEREFCISIPEEEISYIAMHIKGANIIGSDGSQKDADDIIEISRLTKKLLGDMSIIFSVDLVSDKRLEKDLKNHLGPALTRLRLGMKIRNPILDEIKGSYMEIFQAVNRIFFDKVYDFTKLDRSINIPEDEIGYITIHFAAAIERYIGLNGVIRVITACPTGVGTSRLVATKLESKFSNIQVVDNMSIMNISSEVLASMDVDLIIATVDINEYMEDGMLHGKDSIVINTLPSDKDYKKIEDKIKQILRKKIYNGSHERLENRLCYGHSKVGADKFVFSDAGIDKDLTGVSLDTGINKSIYRVSIDYYRLAESITYSTISGGNELIGACTNLISRDKSERDRIYTALKDRCDINMPYFEDLGLYLMHCKIKGVKSRLGFMNVVEEFESLSVYNGKRSQKKIKSVVVLILEERDLYAKDLFASISSRLVEDDEFLEAISCLDRSKIQYIVDQEIEKQVEKLADNSINKNRR
ncbi:transcription antiterminator [Peptostreptococcus anaerobius]|uniref:BglG family transcription antiterminator n=1 Tax=Peptostreptococcus anaerobius TaxID=1261 RepID=UPI001D067822|nr:transcription antiterminator [Peptostreptococcus anaerobius]MCB6983770.1 transcription antiterminator [Peptostreptococcus anaerobius]MCQ5151621.1 transcription antiterminator [Peptostreptococcus anaerobius]